MRKYFFLFWRLNVAFLRAHGWEHSGATVASAPASWLGPRPAHPGYGSQGSDLRAACESAQFPPSQGSWEMGGCHDPLKLRFSSVCSFIMTGKFPFLLSTVKFRCFAQPLFLELGHDGGVGRPRAHVLSQAHQMTNIYTKMTNIYRAATDNTDQNLPGKMFYD